MSTSKPPAAPKKRVTKAKAPRVKKAATRARRAPSLAVSPEERWRMVAVAAYHKAEKRGFTAGGALDDWLDAEREVEALLGAQQAKT
ncbi:MAG: DUF2934 domain-containing protein [Gammaproteobacteria bacterium]